MNARVMVNGVRTLVLTLALVALASTWSGGAAYADDRGSKADEFNGYLDNATTSGADSVFLKDGALYTVQYAEEEGETSTWIPFSFKIDGLQDDDYYVTVQNDLWQEIDSISKPGIYRVEYYGSGDYEGGASFGTSVTVLDAYDVSRASWFFTKCEHASDSTTNVFASFEDMKETRLEVAFDLDKAWSDDQFIDEGSDFEVSYARFDAGNVDEVVLEPRDDGAYFAVVTGKGAYHGTLLVPFVIDSNAAVKACVYGADVYGEGGEDEGEQYLHNVRPSYAGAPVDPTITKVRVNWHDSYDEDHESIVDPGDYDAHVVNNDGPGQAMCYIVLKGGYAGIIEVPLTIEPPMFWRINDPYGDYDGAGQVEFVGARAESPQNKASGDRVVYVTDYDGTEKKLTPKVSYGDVVLTEGSDYIVTYPSNDEGAYVEPGAYEIVITGAGAYVDYFSNDLYLTLEIRGDGSGDDSGDDPDPGPDPDPDPDPDPASTVDLSISVNRPVAGASVQVKDSYGSQVASAAGQYVLDVGTDYVIIVSAEGYETQSDRVVATSGETGLSRSYSLKPVEYWISYSLNGGENASSNPSSYTVESGAISLAPPTREGYAFAGWSGSGAIAAGSTGDRSFAASWLARLGGVDEIADQAYTGDAVTPEIVVRDAQGAEVDVSDSSRFKVTWSDNVEAGTDAAKVAVEALDGSGYSGKVERLFSIVSAENPDDGTGNAGDGRGGNGDGADEGGDSGAANGGGSQSGSNAGGASAKVSIANASVKVAKATYTGKALAPKLTVTLVGKTLAAGADYTVDYSDNVNAGQGKVKIKGIGAYAGTKNVAFEIAKAENTLKAKAKKVSVKAKKKATVKAAKAFSTTKAKGAVTYKKLSGNKKITVAANGDITVKKGLKKGTYKLKVKVAAAGNANYKPASKTVTVKVVLK